MKTTDETAPEKVADDVLTLLEHAKFRTEEAMAKVAEICDNQEQVLAANREKQAQLTKEHKGFSEVLHKCN